MAWFHFTALGLPWRNIIHFMKDGEHRQTPHNTINDTSFVTYGHYILKPFLFLGWSHILWMIYFMDIFIDIVEYLVLFWPSFFFLQHFAFSTTDLRWNSCDLKTQSLNPPRFFKCGSTAGTLQCIMSAAMNRTIFIHTCTRFPTVPYMCFTFSLRLDFRGKFSSLFSLLLKLHAPPITGAIQSPLWCPWTALWVPENVADH